MTEHTIAYKGKMFTIFADTMQDAFIIARDIVDGDPFTSACAEMQRETNEYRSGRVSC